MDELSRSKYLNDIEYFSRKVEADPSSKLFMPLAVALLKLNKYDDVIYYCAQGLEHYPDFAAAKTVMAQAYMGKGRVEDAKGLLKQVILLNRFNYKANKLMGDIFCSEQDMSRALEYYEKAWEISPEDKRLKEDIDELRTRNEGVIENIEVELPEDGGTALSEAAAEEIAQAVMEDLADYDLDQSVKELAEDEAEKTLAEIAAREAEQEAEADEGFDMDSIRSEDFEEEIKVSLLNSVNDKIAVEVVPLEAEETPAEEGSLFDINDDEPIELGSFADEVNRADDEAVMAVMAGLSASKTEKIQEEPAPLEDELGSLSEVPYKALSDIEDTPREEEASAELEGDGFADLREAAEEEPVPDEADLAEAERQEVVLDESFDVSDEVSFEELESRPELVIAEAAEEGIEEPVAEEPEIEEAYTPSPVSYDEDGDEEYIYAVPDYDDEDGSNLKYDDEHITPAGEDFITERTAEAEAETEEPAPVAVQVAEPVQEAQIQAEPESLPAPEKPKTPQEKLAEAKKMMAEAQIEALEQALSNIKKSSRKDKYLAGSEE